MIVIGKFYSQFYEEYFCLYNNENPPNVVTFKIVISIHKLSPPPKKKKSSLNYLVFKINHNPNLLTRFSSSPRWGLVKSHIARIVKNWLIFEYFANICGFLI